jgi:UDP-2,3-diacylglucosamine hydrolase
LRFDLPTIGPRTIEGAAAAGLAGIAIVAGNTIVVEPQAMIEAADANGMFVTGLSA